VELLQREVGRGFSAGVWLLAVLHDLQDGVAFTERRAGSGRLSDDLPVAVDQLVAALPGGVFAPREEDAVVLDFVLGLLETHADHQWHQVVLGVVPAGGIEFLGGCGWGHGCLRGRRGGCRDAARRRSGKIGRRRRRDRLG